MRKYEIIIIIIKEFVLPLAQVLHIIKSIENIITFNYFQLLFVHCSNMCGSTGKTFIHVQLLP